MNNEIYGQVGSYTFVNSAASISRDNVFKFFPDAEINGSVKNSEILQEITKSGEQIQIGDTIIIGHTAIRRRIETSSTKFRKNSYCKDHANSILNNTSFIKTITREDGSTIDWSYISSLDNLVENNFLDGEKTHERSLGKARAKRHIY